MYNIDGRSNNECGALVQWYQQPKTEVPLKIIPERYSAHRKSDMNWPGIELMPLPWEPRNWFIPSSGLLRGVRWLETDVSELPVGFIFRGPGCPRRTVWPLKVKLIGCPETPVSNRLTPRNNLEDGIIYFNGGGGPRWSQGRPAWTTEGRRKVNSFVMTSFLCSCI